MYVASSDESGELAHLSFGRCVDFELAFLDTYSLHFIQKSIAKACPG
jgi:hypothetical protein